VLKVRADPAHATRRESLVAGSLKHGVRIGLDHPQILAFGEEKITPVCPSPSRFGEAGWDRNEVSADEGGSWMLRSLEIPLNIRSVTMATMTPYRQMHRADGWSVDMHLSTCVTPSD
jgi:hypothetical protein